MKTKGRHLSQHLKLHSYFATSFAECQSSVARVVTARAQGPQMSHSASKRDCVVTCTSGKHRHNHVYSSTVHQCDQYQYQTTMEAIQHHTQERLAYGSYLQTGTEVRSSLNSGIEIWFNILLTTFYTSASKSKPSFNNADIMVLMHAGTATSVYF